MLNQSFFYNYIPQLLILWGLKYFCPSSLSTVSYSFFLDSNISLHKECLESLHSIPFRMCSILFALWFYLESIYFTIVFSFIYRETGGILRVNIVQCFVYLERDIKLRSWKYLKYFFLISSFAFLLSVTIIKQKFQ